MMKVSTRGRYALRLMIDLAHHRNEGYVSLKEISARQDITVRYLEQIIAILLKAGFVQSSGERREDTAFPDIRANTPRKKS